MKVFWMIFVVVAALALSGCGGGGTPSTEGNSSIAKIPTDLGIDRPESLK